MNTQQAEAIALQLGLKPHGLRIESVGGGDTSPTSRLICNDGSVFIKSTAVAQADLLDCEADGLHALAQTGTVRVPTVLGYGVLEHSDCAWLALEDLELKPRNTTADRVLGQRLAALHDCTGPHHGWSRDNYIGLSRQWNRPTADWSAFFIHQRLRPQIEQLQATQPGVVPSRLVNPVLHRWSSLCRHHQPPPSLLHGDLWSGNASCLAGDCPVVYDPAVHYGDAECDLAMADQFGGFSEQFFQAYEQARPQPAGWRERRVFYQLYHLLNHANLFGSVYVRQVQQTMVSLSS